MTKQTTRWSVRRRVWTVDQVLASWLLVAVLVAVLLIGLLTYLVFIRGVTP